MCDSMVGKTVDVVQRGEVIDEGRGYVVIRTSGRCSTVPRSACTVVAPEVREGDLVEAKSGEDLVRGRVLLLDSGAAIDRSDDTIKISATWRIFGESHTWVNLKNVTILERADGSKP